MQGQREAAIVQMPQDIAAHRAIGAEMGRTWFLAMLADAYKTRGQVEDGLRVLAEALDMAGKTGEGAYGAELHRLKGTLTLKQSGVRSPASEVQKEVENSRVGIAHHAGTVTEVGTVGGAQPTGEEEAEECFLKAVEIARKQQAKSLELRAVMSLSRLWQRQGKKEKARQMLAEIYGWFTEGFDTADLQEAKSLLEELQE